MTETCPVVLAIAVMEGAPTVKPSRFSRQLEIENQIVELRPDNDEACEILDALTLMVERRYGYNEDFEHYARLLRQTIEGLRERL